MAPNKGTHSASHRKIQMVSWMAVAILVPVAIWHVRAAKHRPSAIQGSPFKYDTSADWLALSRAPTAFPNNSPSNAIAMGEAAVANVRDTDQREGIPTTNHQSSIARFDAMAAYGSCMMAAIQFAALSKDTKVSPPARVASRKAACGIYRLANELKWIDSHNDMADLPLLRAQEDVCSSLLTEVRHAIGVGDAAKKVQTAPQHPHG